MTSTWYIFVPLVIAGTRVRVYSLRPALPLGKQCTIPYTN